MGTAALRGEIWTFALGGRTELLPMAIVQSDALTGEAPTVIGVVVTSLPQRAGEPLVLPLDAQSAGLGGPAWLKVTQVQTVPLADARERLGSVPPQTLARLDGALSLVLGLPVSGGAAGP